MTKDEAIDKIRKLLRTHGRTEAESDTAQILAAAIADRHGIDIAQVDQAEQQREATLTHRKVGEWGKAPPEAEYAAHICKEFFEVLPLHEHGWTTRINFIGTELHIEIATYVFEFLIKEFRWQWNRRRGRCRNRKQFIWGAYLALACKLRERFERPSNASLELEISWDAKRRAYMEEQFGKTESASIAPKKKAGAAINRGWQAGRDIEIRPGVASGPTAKAAALPSGSTRLLNAPSPQYELPL